MRTGKPMIELVQNDTENTERTTSRVRRRRTRQFEHELPWILLASALLSPLATRVYGWKGPTPFNIPAREYITILIGAAAVLASLRMRHQASTPFAAIVIRLGSVAAAASIISIVLRRSANSFYTAPSLMEGMALLLALHGAARVMRWLARPRAKHVTLPAVALADGLASVSAWSLLAFWILVAFERRHVASGVLVFTGVLLLLACAILIPDSLAARGMLPRSAGHATVTPKEKRRHLELVDR